MKARGFHADHQIVDRYSQFPKEVHQPGESVPVQRNGKTGSDFFALVVNKDASVGL